MSSWYNDGRVFREFASALVNAGVVETSDEFTDLCDDPSSYNGVFQAWDDADRPNGEEDTGWEEFMDALPESGEEDEEEQEEE